MFPSYGDFGCFDAFPVSPSVLDHTHKDPLLFDHVVSLLGLDFGLVNGEMPGILCNITKLTKCHFSVLILILDLL